MSDAVTFPEGIKAYKPRAGAPEFVKANIVIEKAKLSAWLASQGDTVRMDLNLSRAGDKLYLRVDNWKPNPDHQSAPRQEPAPEPFEEGSCPF